MGGDLDSAIFSPPPAAPLPKAWGGEAAGSGAPPATSETVVGFSGALAAGCVADRWDSLAVIVPGAAQVRGADARKACGGEPSVTGTAEEPGGSSTTGESMGITCGPVAEEGADAVLVAFWAPALPGRAGPLWAAEPDAGAAIVAAFKSGTRVTDAAMAATRAAPP
jgi:hypothetical protein